MSKWVIVLLFAQSLFIGKAFSAFASHNEGISDSKVLLSFACQKKGRPGHPLENEIVLLQQDSATSQNGSDLLVLGDSTGVSGVKFIVKEMSGSLDLDKSSEKALLTEKFKSLWVSNDGVNGDLTMAAGAVTIDYNSNGSQKTMITDTTSPELSRMSIQGKTRRPSYKCVLLMISEEKPADQGCEVSESDPDCISVSEVVED